MGRVDIGYRRVVGFLRRRFGHLRGVGLALDVQERVGEIRGTATAAAVTLTVFLSLLPLLLVAVAVVGFVSAGSGRDLAGEVIDQLGLTGEAARTVREAVAAAESSRRAASVLGLAGLAWSGLGVANAVASAVASAWQQDVDGLRTRLRGILWLGGFVVVGGASAAVTALLNVLPGPLAPVNVLAGLALSVALFWWTLWLLGARAVGWAALLPGAAVLGLGFEALKVAGTVVLPRMVAGSSALYGSLGVVFGLLGWLLLFGRLLVYASTVNVVLWERRHGTVRVEIEAPHLPGAVPLEADRSGRVTSAVPAGTHHPRRR